MLKNAEDDGWRRMGLDNREKYEEIFCRIFLTDDRDNLMERDVFNTEHWNSFEHFMFVSQLEQTFDLHISGEDITKMTSFQKGLAVLSRYGVQF